MSNSIQFSHFLTREQHDALFNHWENSVRSEPGKPVDYNSPERKAWSEQFKVVSESLKKGITEFLTAKRDAGELSPIAFLDRRHHRFADAWNRFVDGKEKGWDLSKLTGPLDQQISLEIAANRRAKGEPDEVRALSHAAIVETMGKGEFLHLGSDVSDTCSVTGQRLHLQIRAGWNPLLCIEGRDEKGWLTLLPLTEEASMPSVITQKIPVPSGQLLVADWFRFDDNLFTNLVKKGAPDDSICQGYGRKLLTEHYAQNFGFMSVEVGDSCPHILLRDDHMVMGSTRGSDGEAQGADVGMVCTDLHWVTAIDRQALENVVATHLGAEKAKTLVDVFVKDAVASSDLNVVEVEPGELHFHFTAERDDLAQFRADGVSFENVDPYVVVSREPLEWVPVAAASKKPRP